MKKPFIVKYRREKPYKASGQTSYYAEAETDAANQFHSEAHHAGCDILTISAALLLRSMSRKKKDKAKKN